MPWSAAAGSGLSRALDLDGSTEGLTQDAFTTWSITNVWSWAAWVKFGNAATGGTLFELEETGSSANSRFALTFNGTNWRVTGRDNAGTLRVRYDFNDTLSDNVWYHVLVVYDSGAAANNRALIWVDGTTVTLTTALDDSGAGTYDDSSRKWSFGSNVEQSSFDNIDPAQVTAWDVALDGNDAGRLSAGWQINPLENNGNYDKSANVVGFWDFGSLTETLGGINIEGTAARDFDTLTNLSNADIIEGPTP